MKTLKVLNEIGDKGELTAAEYVDLTKDLREEFSVVRNDWRKNHRAMYDAVKQTISQTDFIDDLLKSGLEPSTKMSLLAHIANWQGKVIL